MVLLCFDNISIAFLFFILLFDVSKVLFSLEMSLFVKVVFWLKLFTSLEDKFRLRCVRKNVELMYDKVNIS